MTVSYVENSNYDVLGITETWLLSGVGTDAVRIPNYEFIRLDRQTHAGGIDNATKGYQTRKNIQRKRAGHKNHDYESFPRSEVEEIIPCPPPFSVVVDAPPNKPARE
ncbi:uncharacterized protein [Leptinotarsa decemlineata]|uniref:uncharacterized protein n=1 Tax=Leptinotarsa decemlineata TaxID=7539 RepID=UPI003D304B24